MSQKRSIILHNDNIRLPAMIDNVHVLHVDANVSGSEVRSQAIERYQLQRLDETEPSRIVLYASPLGVLRARVDTLSVLPAAITDIYVRITSPTLAPAPP